MMRRKQITRYIVVWKIVCEVRLYQDRRGERLSALAVLNIWRFYVIIIRVAGSKSKPSLLRKIERINETLKAGGEVEASNTPMELSRFCP